MITCLNKGHLLIILLCLFHILSAFSQKNTPYIKIGESCTPPEILSYNDSLIDRQVNYLLSYDSTTTARFSSRSLLTGLNSGLAKLLIQYSNLETQPVNDSTRIAILETKQKIQQILLLINQDINTTIAELDCQANQLKEIRTQAEIELERKNRRLTILSLLIGFGTTAVASSFDLLDPNNNIMIASVSIIGASAASYIIIRQLRLKKYFHMIHERNPLTEIKHPAINSHFYPPIIWSYLNNQSNNPTDTLSNREELLKRFESLELYNHEKKFTSSEKLNAYYGVMGKCNMEIIKNKITMLDMIAREIALLRYDIKLLEQELYIQH